MSAVQRAELRDTITAYVSQGSGPPLLLMHGAEGTHQSFSALATLLAPHFTVISYDQRDCGDTVVRDPAAGHATLADVADDAAQLLDHLGHGRASVLGVSLGGRVAQAFALRHAQRLDRLVLCNTWALDARIADLNPAVARMRELTDRLPATAREVAAMYYPDAYLDANPVVVERVRARAAFPGRVARRALGAQRPDTPPESIRAPTLLIAGGEDRIVPPAIVGQLAARIPGSRLVVLEGIGHSPQAQDPALLARHVLASATHPHV